MDSDIIIQQPGDRKTKMVKILAISLGCVALVVGLGVLVWNLMPKNYDRVTVENQKELGLTGESFNEFRLHLLDLLEQEGYIAGGAEVKDVVVRDGSVSSFKESYGEGKTMKTTSFLVDIDSLQQTFRVKVYDYTGNLTDMPVQVTCPNTTEMKYPESECKGVYGSSNKSLRNNIPYDFKLASGEKVLVRQAGVTRDGKQLVQVYLYSCDEKNPPVAETEIAVKEWVGELGDPAAEYYTYNIRTGYCDGDAI